MANFFDSARPGKTVTLGQATFELPILYFRDDMFALFFTADPGKVRALMPSDRLHPVLLTSKKALVGIAAFNYIETSIGPYGEVAVVIPAVYGPSAPPRTLPILMEARYPGFGSLVLHLPVTRTVARDAGREEWGYTKFVADMRFAILPEYMECRMSEEGHHILTLRVARKGMVMRDRKPLVTYSVKQGDLIKTTIPQKGACRMALGPGGSHLILGDHPVSDSIRELCLAPRPLMSRYYVERSGILPSGVLVERGVRPLEGYYGKDREGEHTVIYTE
ncbi:MAG: acetoacetate decarboxylase family protein [Deltaproteobacteria bacterium]|nr:acetoacetate decarboxylase family protein [Deltaproteobacteria bacterium]